MRLADTEYDHSVTGCCAPLDRDRWDRAEVVWRDSLFLVDHIRAFAHVPLNFGAVIKRDHDAIDRAEGWPIRPLAINDEVSPWRSDIYIAVDREIPDAEMTRVSGTFYTRVFDGPYSHLGRWMKEMRADVAARGHEPDTIFVHYATCPKCAKILGKNEVVLFARIGPPPD